MSEVAIPVIVFGIILVIALIIISLIYLRLIPSASDYLNNLIKNTVGIILCLVREGVTLGLWKC
jgi:uncharacterized protein YacL